MRTQATGPLATFLDYITYSYMIDNIILLITGTLHQVGSRGPWIIVSKKAQNCRLSSHLFYSLQRPISELVSKCHPLGSFEQMEAIHVASTPAELYNAVLVDTPLGTHDIRISFLRLLHNFDILFDTLVPAG